MMSHEFHIISKHQEIGLIPYHFVHKISLWNIFLRVKVEFSLVLNERSEIAMCISVICDIRQCRVPSRHDGCWWFGPCLASGHLQSTCYHMTSAVLVQFPLRIILGWTLMALCCLSKTLCATEQLYLSKFYTRAVIIPTIFLISYPIFIW